MSGQESGETDEVADMLREAGYDVAFVYTPTPEDQQRAHDRLAAQDMELGLLAGTLPSLMGFNPQSREQNVAWDERPDKLWLLTPDEFDFIPDGTTLVCITGKTEVKGRAEFDRDTRGGFMAWGLLDSQLTPDDIEPDENEPELDCNNLHRHTANCYGIDEPGKEL